jgi:hypothetical protein
VPPHRGPILSLPSTSLSGGRNDPQFAVTVGWGVTLPNPPEYYAINAIEVDEEGGENDPCFLRLWGNTVDPSFSKNAKDRRLLAKYELPTAGRRDGLRRPPHLRGLGVDWLERMYGLGERARRGCLPLHSWKVFFGDDRPMQNSNGRMGADPD